MSLSAEPADWCCLSHGSSRRCPLHRRDRRSTGLRLRDGANERARVRGATLCRQPELVWKVRGSPAMRYLLCACLGLLLGLLIGARVSLSPIETAELRLRPAMPQRDAAAPEHDPARPEAMPQAAAVSPAPDPAPASQASAQPWPSDPAATGSVPEMQPQQVRQVPPPEPSTPPSQVSLSAPVQTTAVQPQAAQLPPPDASTNPPQKVEPFRVTAEDLQRAR
jgi:hypothetical protein